MERGGWIPVTRKRRPRYQQIHYRGAGFITVFVDNLPESMVPRSLFNLFSSYGVVKDVFIPNKRRKATGSRFGFVRYDCVTAARVAVQKANGIWCDDKSLKVRLAQFGSEAQYPKKEEVRKGKSVQTEHWKHGKTTTGFNGQRSFADVVQGTRKENTAITIDVQEGKTIQQERCVWLVCHGIPLNLWNVGTFKAVGNIWGEVVQLDEATSSLESLAVIEELFFPDSLRSGECRHQISEGLLSSSGSQSAMNSGDIEGRVVVGMEGVSRSDAAASNEMVSVVQDTVEGTAHCMEERNRRVFRPMVGVSGAGLENSKKGDGSHDDALKCVGEVSKEVAVQPQFLVGSNHMDGFLMSISGPETIRPNFNLEVVIPRAQGERPAGLSLSNLSDCVASS
ncbi:hypothetical protein CsSME_00029496 [Camellia sinensis var. sinensis]